MIAAKDLEKGTRLERKSDREIVISRSFRAPARIVFDAWTRPEYLKRWWAPVSRGVVLQECEVDLREGGAYRYVIARNGETVAAFYGTYLEIERPRRLVYTSIFAPFPDAVVNVTVTFAESAGITQLVANELYPSPEALEGAFAAGMEAGMRETMELLDQLVLALES